VYASARNAVTGSPVITFVSDACSDQRGSQPPCARMSRIEPAMSAWRSGATSSTSWFCGRNVSQSEKFAYSVLRVEWRSPSAPR
jgi:hypothetical protein